MLRADPEQRTQARAELKQVIPLTVGGIAEKLGIGRDRKQEVTNKIEQLGHEISYIEGLLERFHTIMDIARKVDWLISRYGARNSSCDELERVMALLKMAGSEYRMKFKAVSAQNCENLTVLPGFDLYVQHSLCRNQGIPTPPGGHGN